MKGEEVREVLPELANKIGLTIESKARAKLGHYQDGWVPLAEVTQAKRTAQGFTPDDPLFASGQLWASIEHKLKKRYRHIDVFVGSDAPYARRQELGFASATSSTPPRPYLAPAAVESTNETLKLVKDAVHKLIGTP
jgi:hypothetical protein